jgi:transketolase
MTVSTSGMTMREQFVATVSALVDEDPRVAVVLADISEDLFAPAAARHPRRVLNLGIMEQAAVGVAAGMALEGFLPVVHSIAPFLVERPFEQLKLDFVYQGLGGTFVSTGASYDYSHSGMTHHGAGDVPVLATLPRMQVCVPGTAAELDRLLRATYANGAPTYLRTSVRSNDVAPDVAFGELAVVRRGTTGTVLAVGPMLTPVLAATEGLDVTVLYVTTVVPFDAATLAREHPGGPVAVVEPYYAGVLAPAVLDALAPDPVRVVSIGVPREVLHRYGTPEQHDAALGLDASGLRRRLPEVF